MSGEAGACSMDWSMTSTLSLIGFGEAGSTFARAGDWSARAYDVKTDGAARAEMLARYDEAGVTAAAAWSLLEVPSTTGIAVREVAALTVIAIDDDIADAQRSLPDIIWGLLSALVLANMPVGRVNERRPEGHSGQRKLQEVVGSTPILASTASSPFCSSARP